MVTHVVSSCAAPRILVVLVVLFGYKAVIQGVGIVLAFSIRNVQVCTSCSFYITVITFCIIRTCRGHH